MVQYFLPMCSAADPISSNYAGVNLLHKLGSLSKGSLWELPEVFYFRPQAYIRPHFILVVFPARSLQSIQRSLGVEIADILDQAGKNQVILYFLHVKGYHLGKAIHRELNPRLFSERIYSRYPPMDNGCKEGEEAVFDMEEVENDLVFTGLIQDIGYFNSQAALDALQRACGEYHQDKVWPDISLRAEIKNFRKFPKAPL